MIAVRLRFLPNDSATAMAQGDPGWLLEHVLAAHNYQALSGEPHPSLPKFEGVTDPLREKRKNAARTRARERTRAIAAGEIV